jgi:hypothetical protein
VELGLVVRTEDSVDDSPVMMFWHLLPFTANGRRWNLSAPSFGGE